MHLSYFMWSTFLLITRIELVLCGATVPHARLVYPSRMRVRLYIGIVSKGWFTAFNSFSYAEFIGEREFRCPMLCHALW